MGLFAAQDVPQGRKIGQFKAQIPQFFYFPPIFSPDSADMCVLVLLYRCPHTSLPNVFLFSPIFFFDNTDMCPPPPYYFFFDNTDMCPPPPYSYICIYICCPHTNMCPDTTPIYMSSYYYMCPHTTIYVSSYYYICVHTTLCVLKLLYMCHHTTIYVCVLILLY